MRAARHAQRLGAIVCARLHRGPMTCAGNVIAAHNDERTVADFRQACRQISTFDYIFPRTYLAARALPDLTVRALGLIVVHWISNRALDVEARRVRLATIFP